MKDQTLAALEVRLAEVEARLAIIDLEAEYARSWDAGDGDGWAALFTSDGVLDLAPVGAQKRQIITGSAKLSAFCRDIDAFYKGLHFMHLPRIQLIGDRAYSRLHFQWIGLFRPNANYNGQRSAAGYYDVTYHRVNGRWLIKHRLDKAVSGQTVENFDLYINGGIGPKATDDNFVKS
ncbi:nuclear transport factor 2 family protein [Pseudomonas sp. PDM28]|uniref:nuclear transport factor 2 family protein n=1 Tax=Pseudomonas sp. PDM28 TaxID=2854770 RepID=UPI001C46B1AA|nr:nuclear transport factor 2 family protein [Pseudomonas sp. PDM28]MBV7551490.1 nuclear transport factor 2 family protein [Pseudomonas sp. PDM28]